MWPSIGKMMINKVGFGVPYFQTNPNLWKLWVSNYPKMAGWRIVANDRI